jgi:hypothetical protein
MSNGHNGLATFLTRLAHDTRGNTLALMAAAMIPLIAMIGSGVDMTRAYMAQNRFRQACDAGSLAGRRLLAGNTVSQSVRDEASKYFQFNFPQGHFQSAAYALSMSVPSVGTLRIQSETTIPTTIMKMFGFQALPITASCSATQDFVNTDIMMVFDLSGSMNCAPGVAGACGNVSQTGSKLEALKSAAKSLYATLEPAQIQLAGNSLRLRYGFVNYSSNVNVGQAVYQDSPSHFVSNWVYQSRTPGTTTTRTENGLNRATCESRGGVFSSRVIVIFTFTTCTFTDTTYVYGPVAHDVSAYLAGGTPYLASRGGNSSVWQGCIEERTTDPVAINGGSGSTAPATAFDLAIDLIPTNDATRWRPSWPDTEFRPNSATSERENDYSCPAAARRLQNYFNNKASFDGYIDGLTAAGSTYHDIGMIWGARFISPKSIFGASPEETNDLTTPDNPVKLRGFGVKRYLIFMTDGDMLPSDTYSAYGIESLDRRVTAGAANQLDRHLQRFRMACNAAKSTGTDVWVIAFATTLTSDMQNCASKPEQAAGLSTNAALIAKFQEIGSKIGSLRLSQ